MLRPTGSYVTSLTKQIASASRYGSHRDLAACINRDAFFETLLAAPADVRRIVMNAYAKAWAKCEAKSPLIAPTKAKVRWDERTVMRLRSLAACFPENTDLAKAMGLSVSQVQRARSRYVNRQIDASATKIRSVDA
jgi:acyl-CoA reductase-like NAD-dependent aldehyde dehydrogenase